MVQQILDAGFREIPLGISSYESDFNGGVRYVALDGDKFAIQFLPTGRISWNVYQVTGTPEGPYLVESFGEQWRSKLDSIVRFSKVSRWRWFFKCPSRHADAQRRPATSRSILIDNVFSDSDNILYTFNDYMTQSDVVAAMNRMYPIEASADQLAGAAIEARMKEMAFRENELTRKELFRNADDMRMVAAQMMARGNTYDANQIFMRADELRRDIQNKIDKLAQSTRGPIQYSPDMLGGETWLDVESVTINTEELKELAEAKWPVQTFSAARPFPWSSPDDYINEASKPEPKTFIDKPTGKRAIKLDGDV